MKKLLFATTALVMAAGGSVMTAGQASAEVAVSGDGRFGIIYNRAGFIDGSTFAFTQRIRIAFRASGETDGGLRFGGFVRAHDAANANAGGAGGGQHVFIEGEYGRLAVGDVAGGMQSAVGDLHGVGLTGLGFANENLFLQRDFQGTLLGNSPNALYSYSFDGFSIFASLSQPARIAFAPALIIEGRVASVGASYEMDGFSLGVGYENMFSRGAIGGVALANIQHAGASLGYDFGMGSVSATYARVSAVAGTPQQDQFGASGSVTFDETTVSAFVRRDFFDFTHIGVGASYDLGGGASIVGGLRRSTSAIAGVPNQNVADLGVSMRF